MKETAKYVKETLKLRDVIESAYITLGERFYKIREESLWHGIYESYGEFLADMRVSEPTASKLMQVYRTYVVEYKVTPDKLAKIGWSNLYQAIPLIEKHGVEKAIEKAANLRREDIMEEVRDDEHPNCRHKWKIVTNRMCENCGKRELVGKDDKD